MSNEQAALNRQYQANYKKRAGWWHRLIITVFRSHVNRVAKSALSEAFSTNKITSAQYHDICGTVDRMLWPQDYRESK